MPGKVIARRSSPRTEGIVRRLKDNREHFHTWLDSGVVKGSGGFRKALQKFDLAIGRGNDWAVKLALEYAIGKPQQYLTAMQYESDGGDALGTSIEEITRTVSETRTRLRQVKNPGGC